MTARFVILHHRLAHSEHWDLMLENDGKLATWQLPRPLTGPADLPMPARRIGDHRIDYLTYEGPISGDRGEVRRVEEGVYHVLSQEPPKWSVNLQGTRVRFKIDIMFQSETVWMLFADDSAPDAS